MNPEQQLEAAMQFATEAHKGQVRKYTGEPYIEHPKAVAALVASVMPNDHGALMAAWLHDVVEDCGVTHLQITAGFGPAVGSMVYFLTDISKPSDGNRATRKAIDREHIRYATPKVKTIKLADLIDNTRTIVEHDPDFAKTYLREKLLLLPYLKDGHPTLYQRAESQLANALRKLRIWAPIDFAPFDCDRRYLLVRDADSNVATARFISHEAAKRSGNPIVMAMAGDGVGYWQLYGSAVRFPAVEFMEIPS